MPLSRIALGAAAALIAGPAAAQQAAPAADPAAAQREEVREAIFGCVSADSEEIVVCGRREREESESQRYRVPPGAAYSGPRDTAGDAQRHAMEANTDLCSPVGTTQRCSGGIDVLGALFGAVRIVEAIRARRD